MRQNGQVAEPVMFHCPSFTMEKKDMNETLERSVKPKSIAVELAYGFLCNRKISERATEGSTEEESREEQKHEWLKRTSKVIPKWWSRRSGAGETGFVWLRIPHAHNRSSFHVRRADLKRMCLSKIVTPLVIIRATYHGTKCYVFHLEIWSQKRRLRKIHFIIVSSNHWRPSWCLVRMTISLNTSLRGTCPNCSKLGQGGKCSRTEN